MFKAFKYRIRPTPEQIELIAKTFGCTRFVYNYCLALKEKTYRESGKTLRRFDMIRLVTGLRQEFPWLQDVECQALHASVDRLDAAYKKFLTEKAGLPRFKTKKDARHSFRSREGIDFNPDRATIRIPKVGAIPAILHRPCPGTIKQVTISRTATGKYFASVLVETGEDCPAKAPATNPIGVDLGLSHFAITSDGDKVAAPKHYRKSEARLARAQRRFSRKQDGSANRSRQRAKVARIHERVTNQRKDFLHKLSHRMVSENQAICVETLSVDGMRRNHCLAKSISDAGWSEFVRQLAYKCDWQGKHLLRIGRFVPSSKTCSVCGAINQELSLKDRTWDCACGARHDRDINAAVNIRNIAMSGSESKPVELAGCG